ncbi:MAG: gliding motility-associated C-terminal domain-containing protein [Saprospiraceae bacterium]|nr:gliding motility-associated C-terminal domain-containing protein [Saprospiraceae bacterium]
MMLVRKIILFLFIAWLPCEVSALHIVGGDVTYKCLGQSGNTVRFRVLFTMYRDAVSGGAPFDNDAIFGVYRGNNNNWTYVTQVDQQNVKNVSTIPIITPNPCLVASTNIRVERGEYEFDIALNISQTESYMIAYQRCCRNNTISNLLNSGDVGAAFTVIITPFAQRTCNNSPLFNDFPPVIICNNEFINFDHSATDPDNDQIVYEFCSPLTAGGQDGTGQGSATACTGVTPDPRNCTPPFRQVPFALPFYSFSTPLAGNPVVTIDPITGIIDGKPSFSGQFVVGVCVKEFRNGELLSEIRRDFQFNVVNCTAAVQAIIDAEGWDDMNKTVKLCGINDATFINLSTIRDRIVSYDWIFNINGQEKKFNTQNLNISFPGPGSYPGKMVLNRILVGIESCKDSIDFTVNVYPEIKADFMYEYDTCQAENVQFTDLSFSGAGPVKSWNWLVENNKILQTDFDYGFETPGEKPVRLIVGDENLCFDTIQKIVSYFPIPGLIVIEPDNFVGCSPGSIFFNNLSSPIDETYTVNWNFGDGKTTNEISPVHIYEQPGVFTVSVEIISPIGCQTSQVFNDWITILEKPVAGFSFTPDDPNIFNNTIQFFDESQKAVGWFWQFGENGVSYISEPSFVFRDTGLIEVLQVVRHESGCTDTAIAYIDIAPVILVFLPNAFTPNGDGLNDVFLPKGYFKGIESYNMTIWNRWGEKIFETDDPLVGWRGTKNNEDSVCPPGVYIYRLNYLTPRLENVLKEGQVTLIR